MIKNSQMNKYWIKNKYLNEDRLDSYYYSQKFMSFEEKINKSALNKYKIVEMFKVLDGDHGTVENKIEGVPYLRAQNIKDGYIDYDNLVYITTEQHSKSKRSMIYNQDILLSIMASTGMAAVFNEEVECNANRAVGILRRKINSIDVYFLVALINSKVGEVIFSRGIRGSIQKRLNLSDIGEIEVPIPSSEIQNYIGDKMRKAEELREKAKRWKKEADELFNKELDLDLNNSNFNSWYVGTKFLTENRLDQSFYKPEYLRMYKKIEKYTGDKRKLSEFKVEFSTGAAVSSNDFINEGIPLIRIRDIGFNKLNFKTSNYVSNETLNKFKKSKSQCEDIIIGMDGDDFRSNIFIEGNPTSLINQRITIVKTNDINPYYLYFYINSYIGQKQLQKYSVKTTVGHISTENIKDLIVCIPEEKSYKEISMKIKKYLENLYVSDDLIQEAKKDIEDLIEGNFDMSKLNQS
ncbi:MAG: restriction endonuclease subunit S [Clostridium sp.]